MIWCFVFWQIWHFIFLTDAVFYFSNKYGILFFIPRPGALPCHPERSGTTRQESHATTNHCRTANPAPSGAPAGGISVAERYHMKQRTPQKAFPRVGKVSRQRRMRAKQASVVHNAPYHPVSASRDGGVRYAVRSNTGDPACWRPARGAGFAVRQCLVVALAPTPGVPL